MLIEIWQDICGIGYLVMEHIINQFITAVSFVLLTGIAVAHQSTTRMALRSYVGITELQEHESCNIITPDREKNS